MGLILNAAILCFFFFFPLTNYAAPRSVSQIARAHTNNKYVRAQAPLVLAFLQSIMCSYFFYFFPFLSFLGPMRKTAMPGYDWLIGNHSDELTPWIPFIASRTPGVIRNYKISHVIRNGMKEACRVSANCLPCFFTRTAFRSGPWERGPFVLPAMLLCHPLLLLRVLGKV